VSEGGTVPVTAAAYRAVTRELLVRYLDACAPPLLHRARGLAYAQGYGSAEQEPTALAALRTLAEFADRFATRRLDVVLLDDDPGRLAALADRIGTAAVGLGLPARVHPGTGGLAATLRAAGVPRVPVLAFLDATGGTAPDPADLAAVGANPAGDALILLDRAAAPPDYRETLHAAGFTLVTHVDMVERDGPEVAVYFGTSTDRHLDAVKDALWALDEYAGVRYREPGDPERTAVDISLSPNVGPLRRELVAWLGTAGPSTVAALRGWTRTRTVYRAADANRALGLLLTAGTVRREPEHGRLSADTVIRTG